MPDPYIDGDLVKRVDRMWDLMPLKEVAEIVPRDYTTLKRWSMLGYISTDVDWQARRSDKEKKASVRRVASLKRLDYSHEEISNRLGISKRSVSRYLNDYADHT